MQMHEILNLSFAEIKAKRAELVEAAKSASDLAERFVQCLQDAKQRDEKLSEQGVTITNLNDMVDDLRKGLKARDAAFTEECRKLKEMTDARDLYKQDLDKALDGWEREVADVNQQLASETARAERLKAEALRNATALTTAEKALRDAMAQQTVDAVDKGE